jgi:preprotein translocase subunit SecB
MEMLTASPLTFLHLEFLRVHVQADFKATVKANDFDFQGAYVGFSIKHGRSEDESSWFVGLGFRASNPESATVICPYTIDIFAIGTFEVAQNYPLEKHEKLVYENGAALVYGCIRDMVATITARGAQGLMMLPTPTFMNQFDRYLEEKKSTTSKNPKKVKKVRSVKS